MRPRSLTFACVPDAEDEASRAHLATLCTYLGDAVGVPVKGHFSPSPTVLSWAVDEGRVDIAWVSPTLVLTTMREVEPLVSSVRQGVALYHGVLFVDAASSIRSPVQLRDTTVAWVAPTSAAGYIYPRLALASHGLDPRGLFASEMFCNSHGNVARAVFSGDADVGATYAVFENGDAGNALVRSGFLDVGDHQGRILFATPAIPSDLVVASTRVSAELRHDLGSALTRAASAPAVAQAVRHIIGADDFAPFATESLDPLRALIEDGRQLGLIADDDDEEDEEA